MAPSAKRIRWISCCLILAILTVGCGGGGIGDLSSLGGGTGGTGISVGSVSSFGSIEVNGTHYDTESAEVFVEGRSMGFGDQAVWNNLSVGMIVRVEGDVEDSQNGTAYRVYFNDDIRGPVDSIREIDALITELVVLGKEILIQDTTKIGDLDINTLEPGQWVQVSGFNDAEGRLRAVFLTIIDSTDKVKLKGAITQLDTIHREFTIDGIRITYQGADLIGLEQPNEGQRVEVTGILSADHLAITAEKIERVDLFGVTESEHVEIEGLVLEKVSESQLLLDGVTVALDGQTDYVDGELGDVDSGVHVEVEGELVDGELRAEKIIFLENAKVESDVRSNNPDDMEISLAGLPDITIRYGETTKVTGAVTMPDDIDDTHHVKIIGRKTMQNTLLAIHIIVKDKLDNKIKLQGPVEGKVESEEKITVLGQSIEVSTIPDENFESPEGVSVGYEGFLNSVGMGDIVSLKGELTGSEVTWQSISTE